MWEAITHFFSGRGWMIETFVVVFSTGCLNYFTGRFLKRIYPKVRQTKTIWDDTLVYAIRGPTTLLVWLLGLSVAAFTVGLHADNGFILEAIGPVRTVGFVFIIVWSLLRFIGEAERRISEKEIDKTALNAICQLIRASVLVTAALALLRAFGIPVSAVVAFGGAGGIVIGLAAKDLLANFFGGLMIFLDRPFVVGDWVRSPDKNIEGFVEHVGWRLTRIRTFNKRPLYVPNATFSTISVENPSRMTHRQIRTDVGLRYEDAPKMDSIVHEVEKMLRAHSDIDKSAYLMVRFTEFGPSSLNFLIYCFTKTTRWKDYLAIQQDVYLKVLQIIQEHGAECAFPTTTVHIPEGVDAMLPPSINLGQTHLRNAPQSVRP